jgi:hypothetical protein
VTPRSYDAIVAWGKSTLPVYAAALRKLRELEPPASDAAGAKRWLDADVRVQEATRDLIAAAQRRDFDAVTAAASRAQLAGNESRRAAIALGLQVCGAFATS